ncbi:MAG: hypothetical protein ACI4Q7_02450 [Candidatus Avelusimicrobium sp.]
MAEWQAQGAVDPARFALSRAHPVFFRSRARFFLPKQVTRPKNPADVPQKMLKEVYVQYKWQGIIKRHFFCVRFVFHVPFVQAGLFHVKHYCLPVSPTIVLPMRWLIVFSAFVAF